MNRRRAWLREPLVQFMAAGAALFLLTSLRDQSDSENQVVKVDRDSVLTYMQGRAQVYDDETFSALLAELDPQARSKLIREAAMQEALYREGKALGLAEADPLIRQRIIQQMRALLMEEAAADISVGDAELKGFFERNKRDYAAGPTVSFSHVFLPEGAGARERAAALLSKLKRAGVKPEDAGRYGERFLYQINYSDASRELLAGHFGERFAHDLFRLQPGKWEGPLKSQYGWHLVFTTRSLQGRPPDLAEIMPKVREDALAEKRQKAADKALEKMMARYSVVTSGDME